jgi:glucose-6-phosphate 1-dehydrogenase
MQENPLAAGLGLPREPAPLSVVIFGASGDLTRRKLVPALFSLYLKSHLPHPDVIGFARREWTTESFRRQVREILDTEDFSRVAPAVKDSFVQGVRYVRSAFESPEGYRTLGRETSDPPNRLLYLAVPPDSYATILERIRDSGMADQSRGFSRIIVEKPLGKDLESARRLNEQIAAAFAEEQIYRIDHYLGKETVQNIMLLRFGNEIFEPVWNNRYVDHVQISMAETIGVETRGRYYESAGALRDMMQNHVLQLLCLVAMEPPVDQHPDSIRDEKVKVLKSLKPIRGERVERETVRAQYGQGIVDGAEVPAYREEAGVDPASAVETYAALRVFLDSWRWAGVPFYLRTGKRLSRRTTEISIHFKKPPLALFGDREGPPAPPNVLVFRIQPHEGIAMNFNAKVPGYTTDMRAVNMDFSYGSAFGEELPEAYERLLLDAMVGDSTLYMRKDEVDSAWGFVTEILDGWRERRGPELVSYRAGTSGPEVASRLLGNTERRWRRL